MSAGRILVVDDDPQIRRTMKATLTARHYEVSDSRNGEEALDKLRSETYDLVLLDMNMPGTGGIETCRLIRSSSDVAIIMLTVNNTEKDKVEALDAGADDYRRPPMKQDYNNSRSKVFRSIFPPGRLPCAAALPASRRRSSICCRTS